LQEFLPDEEQLMATKGFILLEATPADQIEDSLQMCARGQDPIKMEFPAPRVTDIDTLQIFRLILEISPEDRIFTEDQPAGRTSGK
jgi:hypothetical protein